MARLGVFSRDIELLVAKHLSPEARSHIVANAARKILAEAQSRNRHAIGADLDYKQIVDGKIGAPLVSVNVEHGRIVFEFDLVLPCLRWIDDILANRSPVLTGRYRDSHVLLADGVEVDAAKPPPIAGRYVFTNITPYARKIERGLSRKAPHGVYQAIAAMAANRFGNVASIKFSYASLYVPEDRSKRSRAGERDSRNPAIVVIPR